MQYKRKILVLSHSLNIGGAELALNGLIKDTKDIYEWHLVFPSRKVAAKPLTEHAQHITYLDLPWWCFETHDQPKRIFKKSLLSDLDKLKKIATHADILLTNTITIPWLGLMSHKVKKPHIWYIHEFGNIDHKLEFILGYKESLHVISKTSSRVLTISDAVKDHISSMIDKKKIDIIHQAIDIDKINFKPPSKYINRLLCLGAIKPSKGQKIALEAMSYLPEYTLDIIGPIADKAYYDLLVRLSSKSNNVSIQGRNFDANTELLSHDTLLMCSGNEALGRVTLEGLAAGKVVVGYDSISTRDLLSNNRGYIYTVNDALHLSNCLQSINLKSLNFKKNREFVIEMYGSQSQSEDFALCINKALKIPTPNSDNLSQYLEVIDRKNLFYTKKAHIVNSAKEKIIPIIPQSVKRNVKKLLK